MPRGGARPNTGPKKGFKFPQTLDKAAAREALRKMVIAELEPLVSAQLAHAKGLNYLVRRDAKTGKFVRVTGAMLDAEDDHDKIEVWEKDPNVPAFMDLLNRALDKPTEMVDMNVSGSVDVVEILKQRHGRRQPK